MAEFDPLIFKSQSEVLRQYRKVLLAQYFGAHDKYLFAKEFGQSLNVDADFIFTVGSIAELIMAAELILDDISDQTPYRQSAPTLHIEYGTTVARSVADELRNLCFHLCSENTIAKDSLSKVIGDITLGQEKSTLNVGQKYPSSKFALHTCWLRCGSLYQWIARQLIRESSLSRTDTTALLELAGNFGTAVQLRNDIIDFISDVNSTDKPGMQDLKQGQLNYVTALHFELLPHAQGKLFEHDRNDLKRLDSKSQLAILSELVDSGALSLSITNLVKLLDFPEVDDSKLGSVYPRVCLNVVRLRVAMLNGILNGKGSNKQRCPSRV